MKKQLKIILVVGFLANLVVLNFAQAQVQAPTPAATGEQTVLINPGEFSDINTQKDANKCSVELSNRLYQIPFSWGLFGSGLEALGRKNIWLVARWDDVTGCTIYQKIRIGAFDNYQREHYEQLGFRIEEENGSILSPRTGNYYLEKTAFAVDSQAILTNVSEPFTVADFMARIENTDEGQKDAGPISRIIGWILNAVLSVVNAFILMLTALAGSIFTTAVHWILAGTIPDAVNTGWTIVRDLCNTFFILILIVIGLSTILRIKEYSEYSHLIGELILMAILVNFSKVIAVTLIDFVSVLIKMFALGDLKEVAAVLFRYVNFGDLGSLPNGWMSGLVQGLSKLLFSFVGLATFLALAGMLIVRIVVLYILIIVSPLAYTMDILPATKKYAHEWWEYFIKNLIWVPVSLLIMDIGILLAKSNTFTASDSAFNVILIMAFFWGAVIAAEHMGAAGGKMIANYAEGIAHKTWETGDMWLAKGAKSSSSFRRATSYLSIGAAQKGWQQRFQKKEHEAYNVAAGTRADQFNKLVGRGAQVATLGFSGPPEKSEFRKRAMRQEGLDEMKLNQTSDEEELKHIVAEGIESKNYGEVAGGLLKLAHDGNINEIVGGTTGEKLQEYMRMLVKRGVMKEGDANQLGMDISRIAEDIGQWNFARAYEGDGHGGIRELGGLAGTESENKRQAVIQSQMKKPNAQQLYRGTTRLGGGFDIDDVPITDANGQQVIGADGQPATQRVVLSVQQHGRKMIENISDYSGFKSTGNKELKTYYMISASQDMYSDNPEVWMNTAEEFMAKNERQRQEAYSIATTTPERIAAGQRFGINANGEIDYSQVRANVQRFISEKKISKETFAKDYKNLATQIMGAIPAEAAPASAPNNPQPNNPRPAGWTEHGGGIVMPPDDRQP